MPDALTVDFALPRRPVLGNRPAHRAGDLVIAAVADGAILQILGHAAAFDEADIRKLLDPVHDLDLRSAGPGQWFWVRDALPDAGAIGRIAQTLAPRAFVVDQTHGRTRIRIAGTTVRRMLAKGTGVDLHPDRFPVGTATMTAIGPIGASLARTGTDTFELLVLRGFAESLWDELVGMSAEFG